MTISDTSKVVTASTSLSAGIATLPKTGDSNLMTIISIVAIVFGVIVLASAIATKVIKKVI